MNKRELKLEKYGITSKRYKELCGFCEQYPDWKAFLETNKDTVRSGASDGMPYSKTNSISDQSAELAIKRVAIQEKVDLIEKTAKEADPDLWEYIIKSVCYEQPFWYIRDIMRAPISHNSFYGKRKYFFFLLDKRK